jgi:hypothetical protein
MELFTVTRIEREDGDGTIISVLICRAKDKKDARQRFDKEFQDPFLGAKATVKKGVDPDDHLLTGIFNFVLLERILEAPDELDLHLKGQFFAAL